MPRKQATPAAVTAEQLADKLGRVMAAAGQAGRADVPLTAVATGVMMLGAPFGLGRRMLEHLGAAPVSQALAEVSELWSQTQDAVPYLAGRLSPLLGWMSEPDAHERGAAFTACCTVVSGVDLRATNDAPLIGGDLLGPLYTYLRHTGDKRQLGAFYTPAPVTQVLVAAAGLREGDSLSEPACGTGGMLVAHVRQMRAAGLDPNTCRYLLNDLDPMAIALAGVNMAAHGVVNVTLRVGDAFTLGEPQSV